MPGSVKFSQEDRERRKPNKSDLQKASYTAAGRAAEEKATKELHNQEPALSVDQQKKRPATGASDTPSKRFKGRAPEDLEVIDLT